MGWAKIRYLIEGEWKFARGELLENNGQLIRIKREPDGKEVEISKQVPYELQEEKQ